MLADHNRLTLLLRRLDEFELRLALPHERPVVEAAKTALLDEIQRLAHALHDGAYWRTRKVSVRAAT